MHCRQPRILGIDFKISSESACVCSESSERFDVNFKCVPPDLSYFPDGGCTVDRAFTEFPSFAKSRPQEEPSVAPAGLGRSSGLAVALEIKPFQVQTVPERATVTCFRWLSVVTTSCC